MKWRDVFPVEGTASRTSTSLLSRARANDSDAWTRLVQLYSRRVYRWCRRAGLQPADAGNVVQEVLRAVARKLPDFRKEQEGDTFRGWLWRITQNKIRDHFRRVAKLADQAVGGTDAHRRIAELPDPADAELEAATGAQWTALDPTIAAAIARVQAQFSDRDWRFFWRVVVDGQSAVDVGNEFGVTANAVRLVKMRVLRSMREELARLDP